MPRINISQPNKDDQPYRFDMKRMRVMVGRSSENDITIEHRSVSKAHCFVDRMKGGFVLLDNGSTNGIKFNGKREEMITLTNGMEVEIGDVPMTFTLTDEECDQLTEERFKERKEKETEETE